MQPCFLISRDLKGGPPAIVLSIADPDKLKDLIWLRDGRLIYAVSGEENTAIGSFQWSPDGQRAIYLKRDGPPARPSARFRERPIRSHLFRRR